MMERDDHTRRGVALGALGAVDQTGQIKVAPVEAHGLRGEGPRSLRLNELRRLVARGASAHAGRCPRWPRDSSRTTKRWPITRPASAASAAAAGDGWDSRRGGQCRKGRGSCSAECRKEWMTGAARTMALRHRRESTISVHINLAEPAAPAAVPRIKEPRARLPARASSCHHFAREMDGIHRARRVEAIPRRARRTSCRRRHGPRHPT